MKKWIFVLLVAGGLCSASSFYNPPEESGGGGSTSGAEIVIEASANGTNYNYTITVNATNNQFRVAKTVAE